VATHARGIGALDIVTGCTGFKIPPCEFRVSATAGTLPDGDESRFVVRCRDKFLLCNISARLVALDAEGLFVMAGCAIKPLRGCIACVRKAVVQIVDLLELLISRRIPEKYPRERIGHEIPVRSESVQFRAGVTILTETFGVTCRAIDIHRTETRQFVMIPAEISGPVVGRNQPGKILVARGAFPDNRAVGVAICAGCHCRQVRAGCVHHILDAGVARFAWQTVFTGMKFV
jgi:hypothetical protein